MDENKDERERRLELNDESGMTRRDMLRRGAIVGGTLLWVAPAIQSMTPKALAARQGPSPGTCSACYCWTPDASGNVLKNRGTSDAFAPPADGEFSSDDCENWCKWQADYDPNTGTRPGATNGPYTNSDYCSGTGTCNAASVAVGRPPGSATCT